MSATDTPSLHVPSGAIDLGEDHYATLTWGNIKTWHDIWPFPIEGVTHRSESDGTKLVVVGMIEHHRSPDGRSCGGALSFARPINPSEREAAYPVWTVTSARPLNIDPSVLCRTCQTHGWIHDGKWSDA